LFQVDLNAVSLNMTIVVLGIPLILMIKNLLIGLFGLMKLRKLRTLFFPLSDLVIIKQSISLLGVMNDKKRKQNQRKPFYSTCLVFIKSWNCKRSIDDCKSQH